MRAKLLLLFLFFSGLCYSQEICNNGIDDDGDGRIDLNDPNCRCGNQTPVTSVIPNASFENYTSCPSGISQLNSCAGWVQATTPTTDYYNSCGMIAEAILGLSNTLMPFPDGDGVSGAIFSPEWNEYLGSCLTAPMLKDTTYQITFSIASLPVDGGIGPCNNNIINYDPVNITIYGTQNCINLPLSTVISPNRASPQWVELGKSTYTPQSRWGQLTITFTPATNIAAIMMGPPPSLPPSYTSSQCYPYFLFDSLTLNESSNFDVNISTTGDYCNGDLTLISDLSVTVSDEAEYQWYKEGIAIAGATQESFIIVPGSDNLAQYCVRVDDGEDCYVSPNYTINNASPEPVLNVIQPNCIADGSIVVTAPSDLYSFDNGVTWSANNASGPLAQGVYYVKTKTASGCISLGSVANLNYFSSTTAINYTLIEPQCGVNGSITITAPGDQFSFDGGNTWQTSNTKSLAYGSYNIKVKDSSGCVTGENYAYLQQPFLPSPLFTQFDETCGSAGVIIIDTPADFYSIDNGTTWSTSNIFDMLSPNYYYVKIKDITDCESQSVFVYIGTEYIYSPATNTDVTYCQYTPAAALTAAGTDIKWYDTPTGGTPLATAPVPATDAIGEVWYYVTQTVRACESTRQPIKITVLEKPGLPTATQFYEFCQDAPTQQLTANGIGLKWYRTASDGTGFDTAPTPPSTKPGTYLHYVCQSLNGCKGDRIPIEVVIHPTPPEPVTQKELFIKQYTPVTTLTATGQELTWYDASLSIVPHQPVITTQVLGKTEYYVSQTINNCVGRLQKIIVNIMPNPITLKFPNYFSPNGDSVHETWNVNTPDFGIQATVFIFDRYGKLITQVFSPGTGWDGTLNGSSLPADDYWFTANYTEYGETKQVRSHFSLIR